MFSLFKTIPKQLKLTNISIAVFSVRSTGLSILSFELRKIKHFVFSNTERPHPVVFSCIRSHCSGTTPC